tara:strand:+ start:3999 stop:4664 length:666 start_codon:yes stop_codon:yes gene_type:complete
MTENQENPQKAPIVGRTIWDIAVSSSYIMAGILFIVGLGFLLYFILDEVPVWFFIAIAGSFAFIPFLMDRAKEDAQLILVSNDEFKLTEYRVGKKYGLHIEGNGVQFNSDSGITRLLLNDIDIENKTATGSIFGNFTQIDQVRDINTLNNLSILLEDTLRENRVNAQTVGIEVEKESKKVVDWALKLVYGSIIPNEISEVFGIETDEEFEHRDIETIVRED